LHVFQNVNQKLSFVVVVVVVVVVAAAVVVVASNSTTGQNALSSEPYLSLKTFPIL